MDDDADYFDESSQESHQLMGNQLDVVLNKLDRMEKNRKQDTQKMQKGITAVNQKMNVSHACFIIIPTIQREIKSNLLCNGRKALTVLEFVIILIFGLILSNEMLNNTIGCCKSLFWQIIIVLLFAYFAIISTISSVSKVCSYCNSYKSKKKLNPKTFRGKIRSIFSCPCKRLVKCIIMAVTLDTPYSNDWVFVISAAAGLLSPSIYLGMMCMLCMNISIVIM